MSLAFWSSQPATITESQRQVESTNSETEQEEILLHMQKDQVNRTIFNRLLERNSSDSGK